LFTITLARLGASALIAATGAAHPPVLSAGAITGPIKINTKTHSVMTTKFDIQFGNATTNKPSDPERIDLLTWKNHKGIKSPNLAVRGGSYCNGDALESWGQSYGSTEGQQPYLIVGGSTGTWKSPAPGQVVIKTNTPKTCGTHIPMTTTYTFYGAGAKVNEIKVSRTVPFGTHHYANPSQEGLRMYVPRLSLATYSQVIYPDKNEKVATSALCDNCTPLGPSAWGGRWFADNNPSDNSGLLVLRSKTDQRKSELEIDEDGLSASNNTAIDLPQPAGGWKSTITEVEYLCFYDSATWPLSKRRAGHTVTLPAGCGP